MVQQKRKQLVVKVCCVIAAFVLWLVTSNDENLNVTYKISNIPIEIVNEDFLTQSGLVILPNQQFTTSLKITGKPSDVYSVKADQFKIVADLSIYALKKGDNKIPINIVKRPSSDISIINDNSMWITVKVDKYIEKTMPIVVKLKGNSKEGFSDGKPIVKPENAVVGGSEQYINSMSQVVADVDIGNQDKNLTLKVPLIATDEAGVEIKELKVNPKVVDVVIPIQKTKEVSVNVNTTGELLNDFRLKSINLYKNKVMITGEANDLATVNALETEPIDLSKFKSEKSYIKAKLKIPPKIKLVENTDTIDGEVLLDKVTQKNLTLNIDSTNLGTGLSASLDTKAVSIVVSGSETVISKLSTDNIKCLVNLDSLGKGEHNLPINIEVPTDIDIISQNIKFVKVTIKEQGNGS